MGLFDFFKRAKKGGSTNPRNPDYWFQKWFSGEPVNSGVQVSADTALNFIPWNAAVKVISETIATLPLIMYRRTDGGKEAANNREEYWLAKFEPNEEQTAAEFKQMLGAHYVNWGNAFANIVRDGNGRARELWPLLPWDMKSITRDKNGKKIYVYTLPNGNDVVLKNENVLHISNVTLDGVWGDSTVDRAKQGIGLGVASEEYGARFFANDANPNGVLQTDKRLAADVAQRLKDSWEKAHSMTNKHRIAILEEGLKWQQTEIDPDKAQFLETRKYQRNEIATYMRIPPHLLGDLEKATFSNIEEQSLEFIKYTMAAHLVRWEQIWTKQLLGRNDRRKYFFEFKVDALLRGDVESRYRAYRTGREIGVLSSNEVRSMENMNAIEDGDIYHIPLNWTRLGNESEPINQPTLESSEDNRSVAVRFILPTLTDLLYRIAKKQEIDYKKLKTDEKIKDYHENELKKYIDSRFLPLKQPINDLFGLNIDDFSGNCIEYTENQRKSGEKIDYTQYIGGFIRKLIINGDINDE